MTDAKKDTFIGLYEKILTRLKTFAERIYFFRIHLRRCAGISRRFEKKLWRGRGPEKSSLSFARQIKRSRRLRAGITGRLL